TELIFVDDSVADGLYLLNLQIASFESDASPSKPVLYKLI
ncbi:MAG: cyclase family protein, partial [Bacteroidota bacterium]